LKKEQKSFEKISNEIKLPKNAKIIIDVGCGSGLTLTFLENLVIKTP